MNQDIIMEPIALEESVTRPNGRELTRVRIRNAFFAQWGQISSRYKAQEADATQELQRLAQEQSRLTVLQQETPLTRKIDGSVLPSGPARWGWWGLVVALIVLNLLAIANAAAFFRFQAQGWFVALLLTAPLMFVAFPVQLVFGKLCESMRIRIGWSLACLGVVAFAIFVFTLAIRAEPQSMGAILDGTVRLGSGVTSWQMASRIILEFVIATALWYWIFELMSSNSSLLVNPDAELIRSRLAALHSAREAARNRLAEAQGNLQEINGSLEYLLQMAENIFNTRLKRHQRLESRVITLSALPNL